jgi:exosortase D (VPLPA-CTERM-specific)
MGVIVEHFGAAAAEGFLHFLEGWVVFMACVVVLFSETWFLNFIGHDRRPFRDIVRLDFPRPMPKSLMAMRRGPPATLIVSIVILLVGAAGSVALSQRTESLLDRKSFAAFPMRIGEWQGHRVPMDKSVIYAIKVDDWLMTNYVRPDQKSFVNFYVAYYASQRKGASAHSPKSCIPGGGWTIENVETQVIPGVLSTGDEFVVNRAVITKGKITQIVYYWFRQRERILTNEFLVKWYLFWDAVSRNRTDGALVRVMTPIFGNEDEAQADQRLIDLIRSVYPRLGPYFPSM